MFTLLSLITSAEISDDAIYEKLDEDIIKVIIELKEEPIIPANKRLSQEPPYDTILGETIAKILGTYDEDIKIKKHKEKIDNEHKKIEERLIKKYNTIKLKNKYKYVFNAIAVEISRKDYNNLLLDKNFKNIIIDEELYLTADGIAQYNESAIELNVDDLWNMPSDGGITGQNVKIAILDSGINYGHTDFGGCTNANISEGNCPKIEYMYDFHNDDNDSLDDNGHGTAVAGIVGANGQIKGMAYNSTFFIYKVCSSGGTCISSNIISGIENATLNGVDIIQMSIGSIGFSDNSVFLEPINNAMDNNSLVVISAGNEYNNFTILSPSAHLKAISVGASCLDSQLELNADCPGNSSLAVFSSRGFAVYSNGNISGIKPDVIAPGSFINTTKSTNNDYTIVQGTSFSSPYVSGIAALIKQAHPDWNAYELKSAIINYARPLINLTLYEQGAGIIDALASYNASLLVKRESDGTNMVYFGDNWDSSIVLKNFSATLNITNKWSSDIDFNLSIDNHNGITFLHNLNIPYTLVTNNSIEVEINITLNNSILTTGINNGTIYLITNISQTIIVPWAVFTINNDASCPVGEYTGDLSLPSEIICELPDWDRDGAIIVSASDTLECNGSTIKGLFPIDFGDSTTTFGSKGIHVTSSNTKMVNNCTITHWDIGLGIYADDVIIKNNLIDTTSFYGAYISSQQNITFENNIFTNNKDYALYINSPTNITVENNIFNNTDTAIYFNSLTGNNSGILSNNLFLNESSISQTAISIEQEDKLTINNAIIVGYTYGLVCSSSNLTIYDSHINATTNSAVLNSPCELTFVNVTYDNNESVGNGAYYYEKYYLTINVTDNASASISNANVATYVAAGVASFNFDWNETTDANGMVTFPTTMFSRTSSATTNYTQINVSTYSNGIYSYLNYSNTTLVSTELSFANITIETTSETTTLPSILAKLTIKDTGRLSMKDGVLKITN